MALMKCEDCGREVSTEAAACPHCGRPTNAAVASTASLGGGDPEPQSVTSAPPVTATQSSKANRSWFRRHPILTVILALIVIGVIASAASKKKASPSSASSANAPAASSATPNVPAASRTRPAAQMTVAQQQAFDAAKSYLSMGSGFSRAGLIQQLTSSAGNGFQTADAVFAVDRLHVNWNAQAVEAAKGYLAMGGFSRASLIQQLTSSAGSQFTYAQAVYAANQVGL